MGTSTSSAAIFAYHRYMIALHGNQGTAALGWRDRESQVVRFDALAAIADLNDHTVLDAGCGHADLRAYLHQLYPTVTYCGVEQIPELMDEAVRRYGNCPQTSFVCGDFVTDPIPITDYVIASGSLNYYNDDRDYIFNAISKLYEHCKLGFVFNLLSHVVPNGLIVAYDPEVIMKHCRSLSKNVFLKNGYSDEDFTVFMYR